MMQLINISTISKWLHLNTSFTDVEVYFSLAGAETEVVSDSHCNQGSKNGKEYCTTSK